MSFINKRFPDLISLGTNGGAAYDLNLLRLASGKKRRIMRHAEPEFMFNISYALRRFTNPDVQAEGLDQLHRFLMCVGVGNSFRFHFPFDYRSSPDHITESDNPFTDVLLVPDDETRSRYQLRLRYEYDGLEVFKVIHRPVAGTVRVGVDGSETMAFSVDADGGVVPDSDPGEEAVVTAGFEHDFEVAVGSGPREPVQFEMTKPNAGRVSSDILLVEETSSHPHPEFFYPGGSYVHGDISGSVNLSILYGKFQTFNASTTQSVYLPDPDAEGIPSGADIFVLKQLGVGTINVRLRDETLVKAIAQNEVAHFSLWRDDDMATGWESGS